MRIAGCFLEYDGRFVILLRQPHKPAGNNWGIPAGKLEDGEDAKTAAKRELQEETGYAASDTQLEHVGDYDFGQGDGQYRFYIYRVKLDQPFDVVLEDAAHSEFRWVTASEFDAMPNLLPDIQKMLRLVKLL